MEVCCSFKSLVGGICGSDSRDRKHEVQVVPLTSCTKDIANHLASFSFSGPQNEIDLILCRAAIFKMPNSFDNMTICPQHRAKLGLGWTSGSTRCRIPAALSNHGKEVEKYAQRETGDLGNKILKQYYKILVCLFKLVLVIVYIIFTFLFWVRQLIHSFDVYMFRLLLLGIWRTCRDK